MKNLLVLRLSFGLLVLAGLGIAACTETPQEDPETWTLRDTLGLHPTWVDAWGHEQQQDLLKRVQTAVLLQSENGDWTELPPDEAAALPVEISPRRLLTQLDRTREARDEDPLLVHWNVREQEGPIARSCALLPQDLETSIVPNPMALPQGWSLDEEFDRLLLPESQHQETEQERLLARLATLQQWLARCAEDAGTELVPELATLEIRRAPGAPALVSYWPQAKRIYLNPLWLLLWPGADASPPSPVQTQTQNLGEALTFEGCVEEIAGYCAMCNTTARVETNRCEEKLFSEEVDEDCQELQELTRGEELYCLDALLKSRGDSLRICVLNQTFGECDLGEPVTSVGELLGLQNFLRDSTCMEFFHVCLEDNPPDRETPFEPTPPPETTLPPPPSNDDEESGFGTACAEVLCEGASVCAESDSSGCDGLGDVLGACEGCEGDTFSGGGSACSGCEGDIAARQDRSDALAIAPQNLTYSSRASF